MGETEEREDRVNGLRNEYHNEFIYVGEGLGCNIRGGEGDVVGPPPFTNMMYCDERGFFLGVPLPFSCFLNGQKSEVTREFPALLESKPSVTLSPRNEQKKKGKSNIQGKTESATKNATAQRKRSASQISKGQQNVVQGKSKGSETKPVATGPQKRRKRST